METSFDILDELYPVLNVSDITNLIDGAIHRRGKPLEDKLQNIELIPFDNQYEQILQPIIVIINIWCKKLDNGKPNETKLKEITDMVITKLESFTQLDNRYCYIRLRSERLFPDTVETDMAYISLMVDCWLGNDNT